MADVRTLREKLEAMAGAVESPHEAQIAQAKLAEMGSGSRLPPDTAVAAPAPLPSFSWHWANGTTTGNSSTAYFNFKVSVNTNV